MAEYIPAQLRRQVAHRAGGRCEYCGIHERFSSDSLTVDHIIPLAAGGETESDNLALCCFGCNQHKSALTRAPDPVTGEDAPLFHPRHQIWVEHFTWNEDFSTILGLSASGRATVGALQLNRPGLVNLRRVLFAFGEHPQ